MARRQEAARKAALRKTADAQVGQAAGISAEMHGANQRLRHELGVHQVELEMQNDELRSSQRALIELNDTLEEKVAQRSAEVLARAQQLVESDRMARGIIDSLSSRLCVLDEHGEIIATNLAWRNFSLSHSPPGGHRDCSVRGWEMACWSAETRQRVRRAISAVLSGDLPSFLFEYPCGHAGHAHWHEMRISRFADEGPPRLVVRHDEITERKAAELNQETAARRLNELARHLDSVREEQNAILSRELHDELGASLSMLKLGLATLAAEYPKTSPGSDGEQDRIGALLAQVNNALQVTRRISSSLRPATLDTLGLVATIRWYLTQFARTTSIETELHLPDYVRLSDPANIAVFRIIQEGLTNVAKHSGATKVTVRVYKLKELLIVRLLDNGSGARAEDLRRPNAFGVIGMLERARHFGGELTIQRRAAGGTALALKIPLES